MPSSPSTSSSSSSSSSSPKSSQSGTDTERPPGSSPSSSSSARFFKQHDDDGSGFVAVRYLVLALSTCCLTVVISNSLALNFTVICMHSTTGSIEKYSENATSIANGTSGVVALVPMFSLTEQGWLFSAIAIGQLLGTLPITAATTRFGIRKLFTTYGLLSALCTLLVPASISWGGFPALMAMRIGQGIGVASIWVVIGAVSAQWTPLASSAVFLSILSCNLQFGPIISMPLAAEMCASEHWDWPAVYYLLGTLSLLAFALFFWFFRDSPREQKLVSARELALIEEGKPHQSNVRSSNHQKMPIPYRAILCDPVFWGIFTSTASANMGFQIFWQYGPLYLNKALGLKVSQTGVAAALPFLLSAVCKITAGQVSDRISFVTERTKVMFFASVSQYLMAGCFLAMALLPTLGMANAGVMQAIFTAAIVFSGLNAVGIVKSTQQVSRHLSHVLFSWSTLMLSLIMLALPLAVSWLTPSNSVEEWAHVFFFIAGTVVAGTTFFNLTAQVEPRHWAVEQPSGSSASLKEEEIFTVEGDVKKGGGIQRLPFPIASK